MTAPGEELLQTIDNIPGIPDSIHRADPLRFCAYYMIELMNLRPNEVLISLSDNQTQRRLLEIECGAPFSYNLGLCLNDNAFAFDEQTLGETGRMDMAMTIGESVVAGQVQSRFIKLNRQDGEPFGVTGLSKEVGSNEYEQWHAITMRMLTDDSELLTDLWGTIYSDNASVSTWLMEPSVEGFGSYQVSMYKALGRTSRKSQ